MCKLTDNKFIPCRKCPNREAGGPEAGYYYDEVDGFKVVRECECHIRWRRQQELNRRMFLSNINPDFTFDDYVGTKSLNDLAALRKIAADPERFMYKKMVYVYGPNGCQKTSMCQCLGKSLIEQGYDVMFFTMNEILTALVRSFNDSDQERKDYLIKRCNECDFLIIDESFDVSKVTIYNSGYQLPFLDGFIRSRFDIGKKSIMFISNIKPEAIDQERFGVSLQSLIERNTRQSTLVFEDYWATNVNRINRLELFR